MRYIYAVYSIGKYVIQEVKILEEDLDIDLATTDIKEWRSIQPSYGIMLRVRNFGIRFF